MKYLTKRIITAAGCILLLTSLASAHSGKTDASGGHWDNSTGEYHYHHGYPAHQHLNGVCPYDYDDQTGWNSGTSSSSVSDSVSQTQSQDTVSTQVDDIDWRDPSWEWVPDSYEYTQDYSNYENRPQASHVLARQYYYDADGRMYTPYQDQPIPHADGDTDNSLFMQAGSYDDPERKPRFDYFTMDEIVYMFGLQEQSLQFQQGAYFGLNEAYIWGEFNDTTPSETLSDSEPSTENQTESSNDYEAKYQQGRKVGHTEGYNEATSTYDQYVLAVIGIALVIIIILLIRSRRIINGYKYAMEKYQFIIDGISKRARQSPDGSISFEEIKQIIQKHQ